MAMVMEALPPVSPTRVNGLLATVEAPPEHLGGATIPVGGNPSDLQAAINAALKPDGSHKLDTLLVPEGPVYSRVVTPRTTGPGWTAIRSATGGKYHVRSAGLVAENGVLRSSLAIDNPLGSNGWWWEDLDASHPNTNSQGNVVQIVGNRNIFRRVHVHGHPAARDQRRGFVVYGGDFQLWNSVVDDIQSDQIDAQAVYFNTNPLQFGDFRRHHVEQNTLVATGENIMLDDQFSASPVHDATIVDNHLTKLMRWHRLLPDGSPNPEWDGVNWVVKNLFEIKWAVRVRFARNTGDTMWRGAQDGTAILIYSGFKVGQPAVSDVLLEFTRLDNVGHGFSTSWGTGGVSDPALPVMERVAIRDTLATRLHGRFALLNWNGIDVALDHNTGVPMNTPGNTTAVMFQIGPTGFPRLSIRRNVLGKNMYGFFRNGGGVTTAWADANIPVRDWRENALYGASGASPIAGVTNYATAAAAGIDLQTGRLLDGSPLKLAGSNGKDLGVDFAGLMGVRPSAPGRIRLTSASFHPA